MKGSLSRRSEHGYDVDDVTSATLTYSDGSVFGFDVCYMLPMGFPTTGQSIRFEVFGSEGALLIDDDHREQILYTEQGHRNAYAGEQQNKNKKITTNENGFESAWVGTT